MERFVAWQARRDSGKEAMLDLHQKLEVLATQTQHIVDRIDRMEPRTSIARDIVSKYRNAHEAARLGLEAVIDVMRLQKRARAPQQEQQVLAAITYLRRVRIERRSWEKQFGAGEE